MSFSPAFFDIFGIATFSFIIIVTAYALSTKKRLSRKTLFILLIIGILGLIVDFTIVYSNFLKNLWN
ncbi:hypothetical protein KKF32_04455 [Patescibacteria group bacterium]|nr:hypothetical protein [Patescibacteria group bacterium]